MAKGTMAVTWTGDIYPCQLYIKSKWKMGNLRSINFNNPNKQLKSILIKVDNLKKSKNDKCLKCWIRKICNGCIARYSDEIHPIPEAFCNFQKKYCEYVIAKLAELKSDEKKWSNFISNIFNKKG